MSLLDTNVVSEFMRVEPDAQVARWIWIGKGALVQDNVEGFCVDVTMLLPTRSLPAATSPFPAFTAVYQKVQPAKPHPASA